ncbi:MAG: pyruvate, phosphate dikinase [Planctomycetes bacterium]|nr:pyruvate, phosphate dikinase [Planctomycetota bacterium]
MAKAAASRTVSAKSARYVYHFGGGKSDGDASLKSLLGGKGANLAEMARRGFNVPHGFTITTEVCTYYYANKRTYPKSLFGADVKTAIAKLEKAQGKGFGDAKNPLLVSVRSGARDSMPGMMDTILNLGLNDTTVEGLKAKTGNGRFAYDSYRRFVQMYGDVVMGVQKRSENEAEPFEHVLEAVKHECGVQEDTQLTEANLKEVIKRFRALIKERTGKEFPNDPFRQLEGAVGAVFGSWMNERACLYRQKYKIPDEWGTAVNVQAMVFGNMGDTSGTGVAFTRNPANGENEFYGEYLANAQGEDVVAGVRTPLKIQDMANDPIFADVYKQLLVVRHKLEKEFGDVQDFEFTIEERKLYMLQTRHGKRTAQAYVKIAHDMVRAKLMTPEHAVKSGDPQALDQLLAPIFDTTDEKLALKENFMTTGLPAGPGAACGLIAFTAHQAEAQVAAGHKVVLCRIETSPEDLRGMIAAEGILTARGGVSSHAALVARQMGKVCVAGAGDLNIDYAGGTLTCGSTTLREGDYIAINGTTGAVYGRRVKTSDSELKQVLIGKTMKPTDSKLFQSYDFVMKLADKYRTLGIRTNADQPDQAENAIAFGAEGIGLCRTEHMFFGGDRIDSVREMILFAEDYAKFKAESAEAKDDQAKLAHLKNEHAEAIEHFNSALAKLLPMQQKDFEELFAAMGGRPVTIRFLDPPLHEFLPATRDQKDDLAKKLGVTYDRIDALGHALHEANPMLGHRGCRLGIVYSEISEMQARAVFRAAIQVAKKTGKKLIPEIMIPLVGYVAELKQQLDIVHAVAREEMQKSKTTFQYLVGTMIEIPRAALTANEIASEAQFFSFGTNDLTQTTLGMSRDDSGKFLPHYQKIGIVKSNPFASIDQAGVGRLMEIAIDGGKATRPDIKLGICGEHGGDPTTIEFCHKIGLSYVSCSPFRVPVARLAAGQAALRHGGTPMTARTKTKTTAKKSGGTSRAKPKTAKLLRAAAAR